MATEVRIPGVGESVSEVILLQWVKADGEKVEKDDPVCLMETDKADFELPAPAGGVIRHQAREGDTIEVGGVVAVIDEAGESSSPAPKEEKPAESESGEESKEASDDDVPMTPAVRRLVEENNLDPKAIRGTGKDGRLTKGDVLTFMEHKDSEQPGERTEGEQFKSAPMEEITPEPPTHQAPVTPPQSFHSGTDREGTKRVPMTKIRRRIAERLVNAQQSTASLTTFNEVDMSAVFELRGRHREKFDEVHGISLGFMSFFAKACVLALKEFPRVNASIEGNDVIYHDFINLGIAVSTDRGLVVPVLRNAQDMSFAEVEIEIKRLAKASRAGKLNIEELSGGTFSVTNGGIYGSMLSTPILNPPQSGILGMHNIRKRPVVDEATNEIVIRPIMYVALTYDHRLIDGRESVSFLVRIKELIEDPSRLMLEI